MTASELGHAVEFVALEGLLDLGLSARHATTIEDWEEHFDIEISLAGYTIQIDLTISKSEYQSKLADHPAGVIPVLVGCRMPKREMARMIMTQVVKSLRGAVVKDILAAMGGR